MSKIIAIFIIMFFSTLAIAEKAPRAQKVEKTFTDLKGNSINAVVFYHKTRDNKVRVVKVEAIDGSMSFFNSACEQLLGDGSRFIAPGADTSIIVGDINQYTYGCQNEAD